MNFEAEIPRRQEKRRKLPSLETALHKGRGVARVTRQAARRSGSLAGLGQGVGKLPECELRLSDRFVKGRKGEKPPMGGYGTIMGRFWEEGIENTEKIQERKRDTDLGLADLIQEIILECSWCVWACDQEDDLRQKDKEKAKEKEKEVAPGDRTPKVRGVAKSNRTRPRMMADQKWTVVREKHHEDRGHGKMCGDWVDSENCVIIVAYCATCELMRF
ncbi:hypothetical protein IGI04_034649 [Brassica rapa subsp. trilocularis]|uniref:Uncharacterized protein n=1 Tax=Brassica rapa subsp. trilocularis TaxID=1813537 RepID=A0ABQ7L9E1_BRACM|nr:hypothetical protein IGI04_034649 [Brassica rapa subsp. trilocularis]